MPLTIGSSTFGMYGRYDDWIEHVVFTPVGTVDRSALVAAVERAAARMMNVSRGGREFTEDELRTHERDVETPNFTRAERTGDGARLYVDCQGQMGTRRAQRFRRILREELHDVGPVRCDGVVPDDSEDDEQPDVPAYVSHRTSNPAGLNPAWDPPGAQPVHADCEPADRHNLAFYGVPGQSGWEAEKWFVFSSPLDDAFASFCSHLRACSVDLAEHDYPWDDDNDGRFAARWDGVTLVSLTAGRLKGARGKPRFLKRVQGETVAVLRCLTVFTDETDPAAPSPASR